MTPTRLPAVLVALLTLALALPLAACGGDDEEHADTPAAPGEPQEAREEGHQVIVNGVNYQVQISRLMNPFTDADRQYFIGLAGPDRELEDDQEWFGVWIRAQNREDEPRPLADHFEVHDTLGARYQPVRVDDSNPFAYQPGTIEGGVTEYPAVNDAAGARTPQGALLLFKLRRESVDNRPLELMVRHRASAESERVILDI
jgi:hypothetical protein